MNPALIAAVVALVEEAIKVYPSLSAELRDIFSKPNPTPQDWIDLKARVLSMPFESLAPAAAANLPQP